MEQSPIFHFEKINFYNVNTKTTKMYNGLEERNMRSQINNEYE